MTTAIRVENLSKKYILNHRGAEGYTALRDVIANGVKDIFSKFSNSKGRFSSKTQEDFWALQDVSFEIKQGDRVGIIGRNGAGKSTLLKILSRITEPTSGKVSVRGRVASLLEVGTGFHPELSGRENIYLNGAILGMSRAEIRAKFDEIVAFAEVERFLDTPVKRYSSGMYVRLAFAVAAHLEPEILIVDEVLAVGDAKFQKKCLEKMGAVGNEGKTILFVSHNMSAIRTLCTDLIWLGGGRVMGQGPARNIIDEYLGSDGPAGDCHQWLESDGLGENQNVKLLSIRITAEDGSDYFAIDTPLSIEFAYSLHLGAEIFYIGFHLKSREGDIVFVSSSAPQLVSSGTFKSKCSIPAHLLNSGAYTIHLYLVRNGNDVLFELDEPISFEIHDIERAAGAWMGEIPGLIRPKLVWSTNSDI